MQSFLRLLFQHDNRVAGARQREGRTGSDHARPDHDYIAARGQDTPRIKENTSAP